MIEEFVLWILGIVEDDPIPYEINHIVFLQTKDGLCMVGEEIKPKDYLRFDYFPLEAQFFSCKSLYKLKDTNLSAAVQNLIDEGFKDEILTNQFRNKRVYYKKEGQNAKFLFVV